MLTTLYPSESRPVWISRENELRVMVGFFVQKSPGLKFIAPQICFSYYQEKKAALLSVFALPLRIRSASDFSWKRAPCCGGIPFAKEPWPQVHSPSELLWGFPTLENKSLTLEHVRNALQNRIWYRDRFLVQKFLVLWYRVTKTHRIPYLYKSFPDKSDLYLVALLWK